VFILQQQATVMQYGGELKVILQVETNMEIKATLNKPYTDKQRLDFIVTQNHNNGYEIKETETALEAWGYTEEEQQEKAKQARKKELIAELDALDLKQIRSLAANAAGTATDEDLAILADLEEQKAIKRRELKDLED
jgi:DNA-binding transcriptional MerR regulator